MEIEFKGNKGESIVKNPRFEIGDIVRISDLGHTYSTYKGAYYELNVESLNLINFKKHDYGLTGRSSYLYSTLTIPTESRDKFRKKNWIVIDICIHESTYDGINDIMYLIVNGETHCGVLIGQDGLEFHRKGKIHNISHNYLWINH